MSGVSVLIEWENVLLAGDDRCRVMLRRLGEQVAAFEASFEILVLFNPEQVGEDAVRGEVERYLIGEGLPERVGVRCLAMVGDHYYDLRNRGVREASGGVVVCLDSDVIPEDGWLAALLGPMLEHEEVAVVAGQTYIDTSDLVSRAFGAGWFFPVRDERESVVRGATSFLANNVAFRRSVFLHHMYPALEQGQTRGSCSRLAKELLAAGEQIWYAPGARATHPAPNGWRHITVRALAHGRDNSVHWRMKRRGPVRRVLRACSFAAGGIRQTLVRSLTKRRSLGMAPWEFAPALGVMGWYYAFTLVGSWAATLFPRRYSSVWRI